MAQEVQSPTFGPLKIVRSPVNMSRTPTSLRRAAPVPGGHTDEVLAEYGFKPEEIAALRRDGVIGMKQKAAAT
jgi:crotonobetainyl-CoA:carnitine CoA-transferase CaiB-like acyl-CoA transferase